MSVARTVRTLIPGDIVESPGAGTATFVASTAHPLYPGMQLVTWRLSNGDWSHDALHADQYVGTARDATVEQRQYALRRALFTPTTRPKE